MQKDLEERARAAGRDSEVWHRVKVVPSYQTADSADLARVVGEGGDDAGSLELVGLAGPSLRITARGGMTSSGIPFNRIARALATDGAVLWAGRPVFSYDALVLTGDGRVAIRRCEQQPATAGVTCTTPSSGSTTARGDEEG